MWFSINQGPKSNIFRLVNIILKYYCSSNFNAIKCKPPKILTQNQSIIPSPGHDRAKDPGGWLSHHSTPSATHGVAEEAGGHTPLTQKSGPENCFANWNPPRFSSIPSGVDFSRTRERWDDCRARSPKSWNWNWNSITQGWATTTTSQFFKHCLKGLLLLLLLLVCTREINRGLNLGWDFSDVHWVLVRGRCRLVCLLWWVHL